MGLRRKPIKDDESLTQYGDKDRPIGGRPFKNRPPAPDEVNALSLLRGKLSVTEAAALIRPSRRLPSPSANVRYTTAGRLRQADFAVRPTGNNQNPLHVSAICIDESHEWTDE